MATVPMIAPDGSVADVPNESVATAVKQGAKIGFDMVSPDGKEKAVVPADQVHTAIAQGAQLDPASAARFAGASVPRPDAIRADEANAPHYADEIGANNQPGGTPGEAENAVPEGTLTGNIIGAGKAAINDAIAAGQALTPKFMVSEKNRQTAKNIQAKMQPQGTAEEVGADTERAATSLAPVAVAGSAAMVPSATVGVPELLENIAGLIRGSKSASDVAAIAANGPGKAEAGQAALDAAARVKAEAGQAVGAAKEAAIPADFKMTIDPDGPLTKTLGTIDDEIGANAGGLQSLKDPALDVVRNVSQELADKGAMDQQDVDAIRQQLNSQIARADAAAKSGSATGDPARYLKMIKSSFDEEYYQQLSQATNPEQAQQLQSAAKDYAGVVKNQSRGPAATIFKANTPEKVINRLTNADATTIGSFTKGMTTDELTGARNGVLKALVDKTANADGTPNWQSLNDTFANKRDSMRALFGDQYDAVSGQIQTRAAAQAKSAGRAQFVKNVATKTAEYGLATALGGLGVYEIFKRGYRAGGN